MDYKISNLVKEDGDILHINCPICGNTFIQSKKDARRRIEKRGLEKFREDGYMLACPNKSCSNKQAQKRASTRNKIEKTNLERYGYRTFLETEESNDLQIKKKKEVYGSTSECSKKAWKTYEERTGYSHNMRNPEALKANQENRSKTLKAFSNERKKQWVRKRFETYKKNKSNVFSNGASKIEIKFLNELKDTFTNIKFNHNPLLVFQDRNFIPDIEVTGKSKIIEFFGDYWHANPDKYYKGTKINRPKGKKVLVDNIWKKDSLRKSILEKNGYDVLIVWESDYKNNKETVLDKIKEFLND